jgi:hypothetical protein
MTTKEFDVSAFGSMSLPDSEGRDQTLADFWHTHPVVFVWLRHFG